MTTRDERREKIVEIIRDLYDRKPDRGYTGWDDNAPEVADRILALMPDPALAEIGRLDVLNCVAWRRRHVDGIEAWSAVAKKHDAAIAAYLTSDHPPPRESTETPK